MIENDKQYQVTKSRLELFKNELYYLYRMPLSKNPLIEKLQIKAIESTVSDLESEIKEYEIKNMNKPTTIRAKFKCESVTNYGNGYLQTKLSAKYSDNPEDNQFSLATPSGTLEMTVTRPEVTSFFEPGKSYYLDFHEAN